MLHWIVFAAILSAALALDLLVLNQGSKEPSLKRAMVQTLLWVVIGLAFAGLVFAWFGGGAMQQYTAGYVVEYSLSVDNVFVWTYIIAHFAIPKEHRHVVLFWGIMCAIVMRFVFIFLGVAAISHFAWVIVGMGLFLIWTAINLARSDDNPKNVSEMLTYRVLARLLSVADGQYGAKFFVRLDEGLKVTSLMLCAIVVGAVDILFAVDSVPAVLAISHDSFIVFSSNAMAIMGLRSLYALFDRVKDKFTRLDEGLVVILFGVGVKMILGYFLPTHQLPIWVSLMVIIAILTLSIVASRIWPEKTPNKEDDDAS